VPCAFRNSSALLRSCSLSEVISLYHLLPCDAQPNAHYRSLTFTEALCQKQVTTTNNQKICEQPNPQATPIQTQVQGQVEP
jgi:hypothetical protein